MCFWNNGGVIRLVKAYWLMGWLWWFQAKQDLGRNCSFVRLAYLFIYFSECERRNWSAESNLNMVFLWKIMFGFTSRWSKQNIKGINNRPKIWTLGYYAICKCIFSVFLITLRQGEINSILKKFTLLVTVISQSNDLFSIYGRSAR